MDIVSQMLMFNPPSHSRPDILLYISFSLLIDSVTFTNMLLDVSKPGFEFIICTVTEVEFPF